MFIFFRYKDITNNVNVPYQSINQSIKNQNRFTQSDASDLDALTGAYYPRTSLCNLLSSGWRLVSFSPFYLFQALKQIKQNVILMVIHRQQIVINAHLALLSSLTILPHMVCKRSAAASLS